METAHLIGRLNKHPSATALTSVLPRRLARLVPRLSALRHVDGTTAALPACRAGDDQLKPP